MSSQSHYTLDALLGSGAYGKVYRARYTGPQDFAKVVAIKVLRDERVSGTEVARLRDEARLLGLLRHRAIVQVHELFRLDDGWAVVMELVGGVDLSTVVRDGPMPVRAALEVVAEVAGALDAAVSTVHEGRPLRLVHRDIKPANLRLTAAGEVKVLDFGIAHADFVAREAKTETDKVLGTLRYMAPERFEGEDLPAGDVYALGIVGMQLLGARMGKLGMLGAEAHDRRVERSLASVEARVDREVLALFRAMLSVSPGDRPTASRVALHARRLAGSSEGLDLGAWAAGNIPRIAREHGAAPAEDARVGARVSSGTVSTRSRTETVGILATLGVVGGVALGALALAAAALGIAGMVLWWTAEPPQFELSLEQVATEATGTRWARPLPDGRHVVVATDAGCLRTDLAGEHAVDLSTTGDCARPVPHPDGARVAYWSGGDLHLWAPGASELLRDHAVPLAFSPDGDHLAYLATDAPDRNGRTSEARLHVLSLADGSDRRLLDESAVQSAVWHADGSGLTARVEEDRWLSVSLAGSVRQSTTRAEPWGYTDDGVGVLAIGGSEEAPELLAWPIDRYGLPMGEAQVLATLQGTVEAATDPTLARWLVQVRRQSWTHDLWSLRGARRSDPEPLRLPPDFDRALPAGDRFVLVADRTTPGAPGTSRSPERTIALWDGSSPPRPLIQGPGEALQPLRASVDGTRFFVHRREPAALLALDLTRPGSEPDVLADLDGLALRDLRVAPTGAVAALETPDRQLVLARLDAPLAPQLADPVTTGWSPVDWMPDGQALVAMNADGEVALVPLDGPLEIVADRATYATALGRRYLVVQRADAVTLLHLRTGRQTPLFDRPVEVLRAGPDRLLVREALEVVDRYRATVGVASP